MPPISERGPKVSVVLGKGRSESVREAVACLQSGLPNNVDRALKSLHTVSYAGINVDQLGHVIDLLMAQVEFFTHSKETEALLEPGATNQDDEDALCNPDKDHPTLRFFNPYTAADATEEAVAGLEMKALRLTQVLNILRNISINHASEVLATHPSVLNLLARCVVSARAGRFLNVTRLSILNMVWKHRIRLQQCALDIFSTLATQVELSDKVPEHRCLWDALVKLVHTHDRNLLVSAVSALSNLNYARENLPWIRTIDTRTMAAVHHYLLLHDAQVVLAALEFFYQLTLHADIAERVVQLPGLVATVVSRVCFAPDQWMDQDTQALLNLDALDTGVASSSFDTVWPGLGELLCHSADTEPLELPLAAMEPLTCEWLEKSFKYTGSHSSALKRAEMYDKYKRHCHDYGLIPLSQRVFGCLVRKVFPKCGCVTGASLGLATLYTGILPSPQPVSLGRELVRVSQPLRELAEMWRKNPPIPTVQQHTAAATPTAAAPAAPVASAAEQGHVKMMQQQQQQQHEHEEGTAMGMGADASCREATTGTGKQSAAAVALLSSSLSAPPQPGEKERSDETAQQQRQQGMDTEGGAASSTEQARQHQALRAQQQPTQQEAASAQAQPQGRSDEQDAAEPRISQVDGGGDDDDDDGRVDDFGDGNGTFLTPRETPARSRRAVDPFAAKTGRPRKHARPRGAAQQVKCPHPTCEKPYKHAISVYYHLLNSLHCLSAPTREDLWMEQEFPAMDRRFLEHVYLDLHKPGHVLKCEWTGCNRAYPSMRELIAHMSRRHTPRIGHGHACQWRGCGRASKRTQAIMHMYSHINSLPWTDISDPQINRGESPVFDHELPLSEILAQKSSRNPMTMPPPRMPREPVPARPRAKQPAAKRPKSRSSRSRKLHATDRLKTSAYVPSFASRRDIKQMQNRAALARENGRLWHGSTWSPNHPCDAVVGQGVRFAAALVLRNISRSNMARSVLYPHLDEIMMEASRRPEVSKVLVHVLEALT